MNRITQYRVMIANSQVTYGRSVGPDKVPLDISVVETNPDVCLQYVEATCKTTWGTEMTVDDLESETVVDVCSNRISLNCRLNLTCEERLFPVAVNAGQLAGHGYARCIGTDPSALLSAKLIAETSEVSP